MTRTIAIMQPYFVPYAGYFRLFAAADVFVVADRMQFVRRGWIHRNRLPNQQGELVWFGLPLRKQPVGSAIADMAFRDDALREIRKQLRLFPSLHRLGDRDPEIAATLFDVGVIPLDMTLGLLRLACARMALPFNIVSQASLDIDPGLRGADLIIAIVKSLGGKHYINAPGGRALYNPSAFAAAGVDIRFLDPWQGPMTSILHLLMTENARALGQEVRRQS